MMSLASRLLVAVPQLPDDNFRRSVVLMLEHTSQGALGLVLNRPTDVGLAELWQKLSGHPAAANGELHLGGPVEGAMVALHTVAQWSNSQVLPDLFLTHQRQELARIFEQGTQPLKVFSGCSGWGPGQLEREIAEGSWFTTEASSAVVFADPAVMWKSVVEGIGQRIVLNERDYSRLPSDPELN